jgi:hypothetical protein
MRLLSRKMHILSAAPRLLASSGLTQQKIQHGGSESVRLFQVREMSGLQAHGLGTWNVAGQHGAVPFPWS